CSLSPRWPAADSPPKARKHHRAERLAAANWMKRQRRLSDPDDTEDAGERKVQKIGFASTYSISSAWFREAVIDRLDDDRVAAKVRGLHSVVKSATRSRETPLPGLSGHRSGLEGWVARSAGPWVYPDRWRAARLEAEFGDGRRRADFPWLAEAGRKAAAALIEVMGLGAPTDYLALVVQDLDGMGVFLSGEGLARDDRPITVSVAEHRRVSDRLQKAGDDQVAALRTEEVMGVPVYAGGDDLLAFAPAATALTAAEKVHSLLPPELPTASTAVLFFHHTASLRRALDTARTMVQAAKDRVPGKGGLAVGFLRRSGARAESIQPWVPDGGGSPVIELFAMLGRGQEYRISPGLVADLERDRDELGALRHEYPDHYAAEIRRLVARHTSGPRGPGRDVRVREAAAALVDLAARERAIDDRGAAAHVVAPARVGVFLRQEAR
ncbi:MAG: Cas10/Cmr2 second palm domain-containing protein, partial [Streptomycetales bacterium]